MILNVLSPCSAAGVVASLYLVVLQGTFSRRGGVYVLLVEDYLHSQHPIEYNIIVS